MATPVKDLRSKAELDAAIKEGGPVILHFWAAWCQASAHMDSVFDQLCTDSPLARFFRVEAEEQPEISESFEVSAVPFFVFIKDGIVVDKLEGANPAELASKAAHVAGPASQVKKSAPASLGMAAGPAVLQAVKDIAKEKKDVQNDTAAFTLSESLRAQLQDMVDTNSVMLFMKGTPQQPRCGFSRKVVDVLNEIGVKYGSFDILSDDNVRQGLKIFSDWPTFPQLFCKGELLGGCDITLEMHKSGELKQVFEENGLLPSVAATSENGTAEGSAEEISPPQAKPDEANVPESGVEAAVQPPSDNASDANGSKEGVSEALRRTLEGLINSKPIMLFMKGTPEEPRCGFSRRVVDALKEEGIEYGNFNILSDDDVRQGLKSYSNWPTFPQLYIKGELIGGCDIVTEMHANGELKQVLTEKGLLPEESIKNRLKSLINSSPTMLFMKGTPDAPRCGFSSKVVTALKEEGVDFKGFDILSDDEVRQGLKTYSNWPTYPQLYHKGELIGGCDIVLEMQKSGELKTALLP